MGLLFLIVIASIESIKANIDTILYKLSGGADRDTRECIKINLTEDLV